jgi:hypothetical protein
LGCGMSSCSKLSIFELCYRSFEEMGILSYKAFRSVVSITGVHNFLRPRTLA